jgi:hypothetical protein
MNISLPIKINAEIDPTEKYEIGAQEHDAHMDGLNREVEYWQSVFTFNRISGGLNNPATIGASEKLRWAKIARENVLRCHSIRVIPPEDE